MLDNIKYEDECRNNFCKKVQRNLFMKKYVKELNNNICTLCGELIFDFQKYTLKHKHYNHVCNTNDTIKILSPTNNRRNRKIKVPNCEKCYEKATDYFYECANLLKPVHDACNKKYHARRNNT